MLIEDGLILRYNRNMKKETIILILGFIMVVTPFVGLPGSWEAGISVLTGIGVIITILLLRQEIMQKPFSLKKHFEKRMDSFVQNGGGHDNEF